MTRLILSTSNIMMDGPSIMTRRPGSPQKSNLELTNSLRNNFRAAQQDYSPLQSGTPAEGPNGGTSTNGRVPANVWTTRIGNDLYIPTIDYDQTVLSEPYSQYDTTVKLFYLPTASPSDRSQHTKDAISLVLKTLNISSIDLLIVSFPGLSFTNDCEWEADKENSLQGNTEEEIATWPIIEKLHEEGTVKRLGLAEFGSEKLKAFLSALSNPKDKTSDSEKEKEATKLRIRPQVDQINVQDCCNVPPPLITLAKQEGIDLLTHTDCVDVLPSGTLRELLGQEEGGAGILSNGERDREDDGGGMKGDVVPLWVVKYTTVVRDRGVIESKGYFAAAELKE